MVWRDSENPSATQKKEGHSIGRTKCGSPKIFDPSEPHVSNKKLAVRGAPGTKFPDIVANTRHVFRQRRYTRDIEKIACM